MLNDISLLNKTLRFMFYYYKLKQFNKLVSDSYKKF